MKTTHAPENLIPSAKLMSSDLARQVLPQDVAEATLSKNARKRLRKKAAAEGVSADEVTITESMLSAGMQRVTLTNNQGPFSSSNQSAFSFTSGQTQRPSSFPSAASSSFPSAAATSGAAGNRVPMTSDGHVDLQ